jgi:NhaP-type Na+/H+ or K+/H+ antiporter
MPGNAEFAAYVVINIFLAILLFDDAWNANDWAFANVVLGSAYLLSRGIAKASRVLEA